jgi:Sugar (and other) transporter
MFCGHPDLCVRNLFRQVSESLRLNQRKPLTLNNFHSIRGILGSIIAVVCNLGILLGYIITSYMNYFTVPYLVLSVLVGFFIGFARAPESPKYLMMRNKMDDAELSLKHLRGFKEANQKLAKEFLEEIQTLRNSIKSDAEAKDQLWTFEDLTTRSALRGIFIGISIMFFSVTTGVFVISNYTASIFKDAGSSVNPEMSAIIVGFILLLGSYIATMLIDRMGRKVLLITSGVGSSASLSVLATYFYLQHHGFDITRFAWLPLVSLSSLMFLGSVGLLTLPFVLLTEVLAQKVSCGSTHFGSSQISLFA